MASDDGSEARQTDDLLVGHQYRWFYAVAGIQYRIYRGLHCREDPFRRKLSPELGPLLCTSVASTCQVSHDIK